MSDLVIVSKLADLTGVPYYGDLKLGSATMSPLTESTSCVLTGFDETIQAHSYDPIRCCNAAVYKCISSQEFYIFCPLSEPKYLLVYKTGSIFSQSRYQNVQYGEIYLDTLNYGNISSDGASFPYFNFSLDYRNVGGDNKVTWIEDLPIFENLKDFVNYVTKPRPSVKVSYYLPDDTYTYSKLTYNSEHEPEDKDDGTSIDILPTNTSVNVNGLQENMLYYFTIFTNKSESEPFPFVVGDMDHYPVPEQFRTEYNNIFIMPLSDISNPPGGSSWDYGYQQFIDTYLPHYTDYSYSGLNSSPYMLDVASATTNKDANMKMSSTKIDMLITPDNKIKFRNYVSDVSLNGYNKLQYRYLANYDCKMVGPYSYDSSDVWGDKSFNSDVDLWTYVSRNIRFVNVYYGINWDNALIMR